MYRLKPNIPDFEVVDGPLAGRKYKAGQVYAEIPAEERHKFDPEFPHPEGEMSPVVGQPSPVDIIMTDDSVGHLMPLDFVDIQMSPVDIITTDRGVGGGKESEENK